MTPLPTNYTLHGETLEVVTSARYLGADIADDLSWKTHVTRITNKANKSGLRKEEFKMSHLVEKPTMWFPNRSDTNRPVQAQKRTRSLKFRI